MRVFLSLRARFSYDEVLGEAIAPASFVSLFQIAFLEFDRVFYQLINDGIEVQKEGRNG